MTDRTGEARFMNATRSAPDYSTEGNRMPAPRSTSSSARAAFAVKGLA